MSIRRPIGLAVLAFAAACADNDVNEPIGAFGTVSTSIGGAAFNGSVGVAAAYSNGVVAFAATQVSGQTARQLTVTISGVTAPGTFSFGNTSPNIALYTEAREGTNGTWSSAESGGTGSLRITTLTSTRVAGEFVLIPLSPVPDTDATGTKQLSGGTFDIRIGG